MAPRQNKAAKAKKPAVRKVAEKTIRKTAAPVKRGQPTAAARLVSSSYVSYGWHRPLSGEIKATVQTVTSVADSMYMLEIQRDRPISSLSLRNAIFWEHRQLPRQCIVSTPAIDHLDFFPTCPATFRETVLKVCPQEVEDGESEDGSSAWSLHYVFDTIRQREFLLLPVEIDDAWVTIIARFQARGPQPGKSWVDREVADLAIIDPLEQGREARRELVVSRLQQILRLGCIELDGTATMRNIALAPVQHKWESGLVAYAFSREFLRRIRVLLWRQGRSLCPSESEQMLWADFQEDYNLDAYRQNLMAACAHQCIEKSGYQLRMALEVPSEGSNYDPLLLQRPGAENDLADERWEIFQSPSHTLILQIPDDHMPPSHSVPSTPGSPGSPALTSGSASDSASVHESQGHHNLEVNSPPESPDVVATPVIDTPSHPTSNSSPNAEETVESSPRDAYLLDVVGSDADADADYDEDDSAVRQNAPVAPMGTRPFSGIPGLQIINQNTSGFTAFAPISVPRPAAAYDDSADISPLSSSRPLKRKADMLEDDERAEKKAKF